MAEFRLGAHALSQLPDDSLAEVAFAGRSNAGKSSAINALTGQNKLARTSKTPGRTQEINYFALEPGNYLVDLPGYGYAKTHKSMRDHWQKTLPSYLQTRPVLRGLVLIMDCRRPLTDLDWNLIERVAEKNTPLHLVLTKSDKLSKNAANKSLLAACKQLEDAGFDASLQLFSSLKHQGIRDCLTVINDWLDAKAPAETDPEE